MISIKQPTRVYPHNFSKDLVSVWPMGQPRMPIFYMKWTKGGIYSEVEGREYFDFN